MGWVFNETDYICCFALFCTCQYNKLIELEPLVIFLDLLKAFDTLNQ